MNYSVIDPKVFSKNKDSSKDDILAGNVSHHNLKVKRKSKSKDGGVNKSISQNIKRFMEKKKNIKS